MDRRKALENALADLDRVTAALALVRPAVSVAGKTAFPAQGCEMVAQARGRLSRASAALAGVDAFLGSVCGPPGEEDCDA